MIFDGVIWIFRGIMVLLFFISLGFFYQAINLITLSRTIKKTKTSNIVDVRKGFIELKGRVEPIEDLIIKTPITQTPTIQYTTKIEYYSTSGEHSSWYKLWERAEGVPFLLNDDTAKIKIDPKDANIDIENSTREKFTRSEVPWEIMELIKREGLTDLQEKISKHGTMRYTEKSIPLGHEAYILGYGIDKELSTVLENSLDVMPYTVAGKKGEGHFVITDKDERTYRMSVRCKIVGRTIGGIITMAFAVFFFFFTNGMKF